MINKRFPRTCISVEDPSVSIVLRQVISAGQRMCGLKNKQLSISFASKQAMQELNLAHRGINKPTDVLSFEGSGGYFGDIVICTPVAQAQAQEYGHSYMRELAFLTAHGFLHLAGYDHTTPQEEAEMIQMQKAILHRVGIGR